MSDSEQIDERIERILQRDARFKPNAYRFVLEAVGFTTRRVLEKEGRRRQLSGQEVLEGIRELALEKYGPLAFDVLHEWGVQTTMDFGAIVFNLVREGLLGAGEDDSEDDFRDGYDFEDAFVKPFLRRGDLPRGLPPIA